MDAPAPRSSLGVDLFLAGSVRVDIRLHDFPDREYVVVDLGTVGLRVFIYDEDVVTGLIGGLTDARERLAGLRSGQGSFDELDVLSELANSPMRQR